jgi:hypothetical protein
MNPRTFAEWGAVLPVWVGLAGVVASFVVYVLVGKASPALLGTFGTMIAAGQGAEIITALKAGPKSMMRSTDSSDGSETVE